MAAAIATYGVCQTGCNAAWVACCAALGYTAGTFTGGSALPAALATCSTQQGVCMAACAAMAGVAGVAEAATVTTAAAGVGAAATASYGALLYAAGGSVLAMGASVVVPVVSARYLYKKYRG
jgi:hypothetical protein